MILQKSFAYFGRGARYLVTKMSLRKAVFWAATLMLLLYIAALGRGTWKLRSFRRSPTTGGARYLLEGEWPQTIPLRFIILRRGTRAYRENARGWLYTTAWLGDYWWNRKLLEDDLSSMSHFERAQFLPAYHLSMTGRIRKLALNELARNNDGVLPLLYRDPDPATRARAAEWIRDQISSSGNPDVFAEAFPNLLACPAVPVSRLLTQFWPKINDDQRDAIVKTLSSRLTRDTALDVLGWLSSNVTAAEMPRFPTVLGSLLNMDVSSRATLTFITQRIQQFDSETLGVTLGRIVDPKVKLAHATKIFHEVDATLPSLAAECLARIAVVDVHEAEKLAAPLLAAGDSELRKGALVVLADAGSPIGQAHIDEAFSGHAPRTRKFRDWKTYIFGSRATQEYGALAHHDYLETGKTWPPARITGDGGAIENWANFIQRYPWFPGTDDAYYRLASELYVQGDATRAVATIREYASRSLPDNDADPYIMYLLGLICSRQDDFVMADPLLANIHAVIMNALADLFWNRRSMQPLLDAISWFKTNPQQIRFLGISERQFSDFDLLVQNWVNRNPLAPSVERVDLELLYGRFFSPRRPHDYSNLKMPDGDPADAAIAATVEKVRGIISVSQNSGTSEFVQASSWLLWHMEEGDYGLRSAYQPTFDVLTSIPQSDLPPAVSVRIFRILNRK
jgi:hypothetical protein